MALKTWSWSNDLNGISLFSFCSPLWFPRLQGHLRCDCPGTLTVECAVKINDNGLLLSASDDSHSWSTQACRPPALKFFFGSLDSQREPQYLSLYALQTWTSQGLYNHPAYCQSWAQAVTSDPHPEALLPVAACPAQPPACSHSITLIKGKSLPFCSQPST